MLLAESGLIKLKDPSNPQSTERDITENPKHLKIRELEGAMLARSVKQVDLAFVFANYALEAGIDIKSALIVEKGKDLYVEFLVARPDNIQDPGIQKLAKALNSPEVQAKLLKQNFEITPNKSLADAKVWLAGEIAHWKTITEAVKIETH